jgi:hypothetical protein
MKKGRNIFFEPLANACLAIAAIFLPHSPGKGSTQMLAVFINYPRVNHVKMIFYVLKPFIG